MSMILKNADCPYCGESLSNYAVVMGHDWKATILPVVELRRIMEQEQVRIDAEEKPVPKKNADKSGYVYVLGSDEGFYKIGLTTRNPDKRILEFSPALPFKTYLVYTIPSKNAYKLERILHQDFSHKQSNGEWYRLDEVDLEYIGSEGWL